MKFSIRRSKACLKASIFNFARFQDRKKKSSVIITGVMSQYASLMSR